MERFARLYDRLDGTTSTNARVAAMVAYFRDVPAADGAWAVWCLTGRRLKRLVPSRSLRQWGAEAAGLPDWLLEASYQHVGDLAETLNLLAPEPEQTATAPPLHRLIEERIRPLGRLDEGDKRREVLAAWRELAGTERFLYNKLLTGALRVGVSRRLVTRALAELAGIDSGLMAHRLMGDWQPTPNSSRNCWPTRPTRTSIFQGLTPSSSPRRSSPNRPNWAPPGSGGQSGNGTASARS